MKQSQRLSQRLLATTKPFSQPSRRLPFLASIPNPSPRFQRIPRSFQQIPSSQRYKSSSSLITQEPSSPSPSTPKQPSYDLTFTCKPCTHRSTHRITKQGYHQGTVLITCPSCNNRHVITDHLKIFMDEASSLEDILKRTNEPGSDLSRLLKKGRLGQRQGEMVGREGEEDIEFWEDGTETKRLEDKIQGKAGEVYEPGKLGGYMT